MKICLVTQNLFSLGGVQKAITEIINRAVYTGLEITVLMPGTKSEKKCFFVDEHVRLVEIESVFSTRFEWGYKLLNILNRRFALLDNSIGTWYSANHFVKKEELNKLVNWVNKEAFDIVIGVADKNALIVSMIADQISAKTIGWMHSTFQGYYETRGQNLFGLKKMNGKYLRKLDTVCVLTQRDKIRFENEMGVKCVILYDPVQCEESKSILEKKYDFIFVGRMNRVVKGLDYLIKIMDRVVQQKPDCKLVVVGNGNDEAYFHRAIRKYHLEKNIDLVGFQHNVTSYYQQSKWLLSTSRWEGFGMSIAESMACGVPCVAFENDGPCEIISNGVDGYLIPKFDIQRFADVLIACIEKKENYDAMCTKAVEKAKKFNLSGIVSQFIDIMKGNELK